MLTLFRLLWFCSSKWTRRHSFSYCIACVSIFLLNLLFFYSFSVLFVCLFFFSLKPMRIINTIQFAQNRYIFWFRFIVYTIRIKDKEQRSYPEAKFSTFFDYCVSSSSSSLLCKSKSLHPISKSIQDSFIPCRRWQI